MGHPMPQPPPPIPAYPENLNEWHQQEYGVPFVTLEDEAKKFDDSFFQSAHVAALGPIPGNSRPSGSGYTPHPPPFQGPLSSSTFSLSYDSPGDSSYEDLPHMTKDMGDPVEEDKEDMRDTPRRKSEPSLPHMTSPGEGRQTKEKLKKMKDPKTVEEGDPSLKA
jgi:hypothetical protein